MSKPTQPLAPRWVPLILISAAISIGLVGAIIFYEEIPHYLMAGVGWGERALGLVALDKVVRGLGDRVPYLDQAFAFHDADRSFLSNDFPLLLPVPVLLSLLLYVVGSQLLYLVFNHFGLKVSKSVLFVPRVLHNVFLVALSAYISTEALYAGLFISKFGFVINGRPALPIDMRLAKVSWVFYFSKAIEWTDTVMIILSGNFRQFSYLHWYHHASVFPFWWIVVSTHPFGDSWPPVFLNALVHVVMYSYYLLSTFGYKPAWKFFLTYFQIIQFILLLSISAFELVHRQAPVKIHMAMIVYIPSLILFFSNFLSKNTTQGTKGTKPLKVGGVSARKKS